MAATDDSDAPQRCADGVAAPTFDVEAPTEGRVTEYDVAHFIDYARILDAERAGHDWHDAAIAILRPDRQSDEAAVRLCWDSHLSRARWISITGYRQILANAGLLQPTRDASPDRATEPQ